MDLVHDALFDGRAFRVLTVVTTITDRIARWATGAGGVLEWGNEGDDCAAFFPAVIGPKSGPTSGTKTGSTSLVILSCNVQQLSALELEIGSRVAIRVSGRCLKTYRG